LHTEAALESWADAAANFQFDPSRTLKISFHFSGGRGGISVSVTAVPASHLEPLTRLDGLRRMQALPATSSTNVFLMTITVI